MKKVFSLVVCNLALMLNVSPAMALIANKSEATAVVEQAAHEDKAHEGHEHKGHEHKGHEHKGQEHKG